MKIVFATDFYYPSIGGVEIETHRLAKELSGEGHDVWVIAPSSRGLKNYYKDGQINIIRIDTPLNYLTPYFFLKKKIFKELKKIDPDLIHIQSSLSIAKVASLYAYKYKVAGVATGHYAKGELEFKFRRLKIISKILDFIVGFSFRSTWKNIDLVTVPSKFAFRYFQNLIKSKNKITTISNGIYTEKYKSKNRKNLSEKTILYVGRFIPSKNVEMIIRSLPYILSRVDVRLILVGGGALEGGLKRLVKELGVEKKVVFTGYATEEKVREMYKKADIFVTASAADNQPLTILEALASGLPVVAANVGGIPELIKNEKNGFLFKSQNLNSFTGNVLKILLNSNLRKKMSHDAIKTAKGHDIHDIVIKMQALYQKAIAINAMKKKSVQVVPFYLTRRFAVSFSFAVLILGILFRNLLVSPTVAKAKTLELKNKIMNSKLVMKIENIDLNFKTQLPKSIIKKTK